MPFTVYPMIMMPLRDGVKLATDVYLPDTTGKFPVIVRRSPYSPAKGRAIDADAHDFCRQGIGLVVQDCRGTGRSEGEADLWAQERDDAEDFMNWLSAQEWFNGRMVMNGESYPGATQWQAARCANPVMKGLTPHNGPLDYYHIAYYVSGAYSFGIGICWAMGMQIRRLGLTEPPRGSEDAETRMRSLPLREQDRAWGLPSEWPLFRQWIAHPLFDGFWKRMDAFQDIPKMTAPAYITGGWFDAFLMDTLHAFTRMRSCAGSEQARQFTRLVIEPFNHDMCLGDADYGKFFRAGIIGIRNRFMANILKNPDEDPLPDEPPVKLFVMGSNRWIHADEWPLPCRPTPFYLHGKSPANSVRGGGTLSPFEPDDSESADTFVYDPENPVPTLGGNNLGFMSSCQRVQKTVEQRSDVLVYTSEPLERDMDVIGYVKAVLYAASSAPDTDFTVKLCDVYPDGTSLNLCDGLVRASRRDGTETAAPPLKPDEVIRFEIDCWATCVTLLKGHRIRIQVSSSCFPKFDRNPNTGHPFAEDSADSLVPAVQKILHTKEYPSHILLPVVEDI